MRTTMQVVPTMNEWDAPVYVYTSPEGRTQVRRDEEDPGDEWAGCRGGRTSFPHAVVFIDGTMSTFDREAQPTLVPADCIPSGYGADVDWPYQWVTVWPEVILDLMRRPVLVDGVERKPSGASHHPDHGWTLRFGPGESVDGAWGDSIQVGRGESA